MNFDKCPPPTFSRELAELRGRLTEAEETLRAIRRGEVDAVVVAGKQGDRVFTLEGAEHAYRLLIESMNEGALTLTAGGTILYANQCFAGMIKCPLEKVLGGSFRRYLSTSDRPTLRSLLNRSARSGTKIQVRLKAGDGTQMPAQVSLRPLAKNGANRAMIGMVVTDMTEARRAEERLRALTQRVVQVQEAERGRVALELHDNITQLLCAVLFRSRALAEKLSVRDASAKKEATKLGEMLGNATEEVERISRELRPEMLEHLGLTAVLRHTSREYTDRTGVPVELAGGRLTARLPAAIELALYRILQEALKNVEKHARAHRITVGLERQANLVRLTIKDDGIGFDTDRVWDGQKGKRGLGLLGMRERATYVGGTLGIKSDRPGGTEIDARIPWRDSGGTSEGQCEAAGRGILRSNRLNRRTGKLRCQLGKGLDPDASFRQNSSRLA